MFNRVFYTIRKNYANNRKILLKNNREKYNKNIIKRKFSSYCTMNPIPPNDNILVLLVTIIGFNGIYMYFFKKK